MYNSQTHKSHIYIQPLPMTLFAFDELFLNIAILFKVKNYPLAIERLQFLRDLGDGELTSNLEICLENYLGKIHLSFFLCFVFLINFFP